MCGHAAQTANISCIMPYVWPVVDQTFAHTNAHQPKADWEP